MTTTGTANMNDLGYEEAEDWEEEGEYDDGDDDEYDDDDDDDRMQALPDNMNTGSISIMAGRNNSDPGSQYAYSAIIRNEQMLDMSFCWNFVRNYVPKDRLGKNIIKSGVSLGRQHAMAAVNLRKKRFMDWENSASEWQKRMGKDRKKQLALVEEYLLRWTKAHARRSLIRCERLVHGLEYVTRQREQWYLAEREMYEADHESVDILSTEGRQYMVCRMEQHKILAEESEDRAKHITVQDFSEWIASLYSGNATVAETMLGAPWMIQEAAIFAMEHHDSCPYWVHLERMQAGEADRQSERRHRRWRPRSSQPDGAQALPNGGA